MKNDAKLQDAIELLLNDVYQGMESEIVSIKEQVEQIKVLLVDAISSLHDSFESIDGQSTAQMKLFSTFMSGLVSGADNESDNPNIFQHTEDAGESLTELLNLLIQDSRKSLSALINMNETVSKVQTEVTDGEKVTGLLRKIQDLAAYDKIDVDEMRSVIAETIGAHAHMTNDMKNIQDYCLHTKKMLNEVASSDLNKVFTSKVKVENVLDHLNKSNELISGCRTEANTVNAELRKNLGNAIRALQFEDIVSQSLGHTNLHLDRMDGFVSRLSTGISELHQKNNVSLDEYALEIGLLHEKIMAYRNGLKLEETNPITQNNVDEGDVDLF